MGPTKKLQKAMLIEKIYWFAVSVKLSFPVKI